MGFRFDSPEAKADPNGQQSGNDFLIKATGDGSLPTITVGKDGEMNTSMADAYLEKHGVASTPAGIWNSQTGLLEMFRYDPSKDKNNLLTAMKVKGPEAAKKSVAGNPYRAKADEDKAAEVAGGSKDRLSEIYAEMTELDESRTRLKGQRNETEKPFPALQGFPGAISAEKAADKYDAITGKMQKLNEEKQKLRGAIKDQKGVANGSEPSWVPNDKDIRADGSKKSTGFLGVHKRFDDPKQVSSEISIGVDWGDGEKEIPTMVPTINQTELQYLLSVPPDKMQSENPKLMKSITEKAIKHARERESKGLPYFK